MKTALTVILAIILALLLTAPSAKAQLFPSAELKQPAVVKTVKKSKQVRRAKTVRRAASRRTVRRTAARVAPQASPARAAVQIGETAPIRPTEIKTISIPNRFTVTFEAIETNFAARFNAVHDHQRRLYMSDTTEQLERAVADAVLSDPEAAVQAYPIEGINNFIGHTAIDRHAMHYIRRKISCRIFYRRFT